MAAQHFAVHALDSGGNASPAAEFNSWIAGTTTRQAVYADEALTTPLSNPVIANSAGIMEFWLDTTKTYKFNLTTTGGGSTLLPTVDNFTPSSDQIYYIIGSNASAAQTAAEAAQTAAEAAQTAAETAQTAAELAETNAETAETNAETAESNAAAHETNASTFATNASASATNAATSETNAAASASAASTSAANASSSASAAATSASNASTSATNAATSETGANDDALYVAGAEATLDARYVGAHANEAAFLTAASGKDDGAFGVTEDTGAFAVLYNSGASVAYGTNLTGDQLADIADIDTIRTTADNATPAADLAATTTGNGASLVGIEDAAGNYTATDLEAALTELIGKIGPPVADIAALKAVDVSAAVDGDKRVLANGRTFVWQSTDYSDTTQSGTDGTTTAGDDQFSSATAAFTSDMIDTGANPRVLEVAAANHGSDLMRASIFRYDSATEVEIRIDNFAVTSSTLTWSLHDPFSPMYWEETGSEKVYIPPSSDTTGASGCWVDEEHLRHGFVRPEWFAESGDASDSQAFIRALDFLARMNFQRSVERENRVLMCSGSYDIESVVTADGTIENVSIDSDGPFGATFNNNTAGTVMFRFGHDSSGATDMIYSRLLDKISISNINFVNKNNASLAATPTVALEFNGCGRIRVNNCEFFDFNISVDMYRSKLEAFYSNRFFGNNRANGTTAKVADIRLQGRVDTSATNNAEPCAGCHIYQNEFFGDSTDATANETAILVHAVDGLYLSNNHYHSYSEALKIEGDNTSQNSTISTIRAQQEYFDDSSGSADNDVRITGNIGANTLLFDHFEFDQCYFRDGNVGLLCDVTDVSAGFAGAGRVGGRISIRGGEVRLQESVGIYIRGAAASFYDMHGVLIDGVIFQDNNGSATSVSDINIDARDFTITNCIHLEADSNPEIAVSVQNTSGLSYRKSGVITGNNYAGQTYTDEYPIRIAASSRFNLREEDNLVADAGETIKRTITYDSVDNEIKVLFRRTMIDDDTSYQLSGSYWCHNPEGGGTHGYVSGPIDAQILRYDTANMVDLTGTGAQATDVVVNQAQRDFSLAVVRLEGAETWTASSSTVTAGKLFNDGSGRIFICVFVSGGGSQTAGSGSMSGYTVSTTAHFVDGAGHRYGYIDDSDPDTVCVVSVDGGTADNKFRVDLEWRSMYLN